MSLPQVYRVQDGGSKYLRADISPLVGGTVA